MAIRLRLRVRSVSGGEVIIRALLNSGYEAGALSY